jgi:hypothetical protein
LGNLKYMIGVAGLHSLPSKIEFGNLGKFLIFLGLSLPFAVLGSLGRIIADEYCMCSRLLELDQNIFAAASSNIMQFSMLVQAFFSHYVILNFGQGVAFVIALLLYFWSTWFVIYRFAVWRDPGNSSFYFALSGSASLALFVSILLSAGVSFPGVFEALTQQTFISQTFFRYPGIPVVHSAHLTLLGCAIWVAGLKEKKMFVSIVLSGCIGLLAGLSHYLLAAMFAFVVAAIYWESVRNLRHDRTSSRKELVRLGSTFVGLGSGLALSLFSDQAETRISQLEVQYQTLALQDRLLAVVLDPIWVLTSLISFTFAMGLIVGFAFERRFGLAARLRLSFRPLLKFMLLFLGFAITVSLLASLVSYSAPWHAIAPRYLLTIFSVGLGIALAGELPAVAPVSNRALTVGVPTLAACALIGTLMWAIELPNTWAAGPLPMQTVKEGPGSGIIWQDTDNDSILECYMEIEYLLPEKKIYLID